MILETNISRFYYRFNCCNNMINTQVKPISNVTHLLLQKDMEGQDGKKAEISRHAAAMSILKTHNTTKKIFYSFEYHI